MNDKFTHNTIRKQTDIFINHLLYALYMFACFYISARLF